MEKKSLLEITLNSDEVKQAIVAFVRNRIPLSDHATFDVVKYDVREGHGGSVENVVIMVETGKEISVPIVMEDKGNGVETKALSKACNDFEPFVNCSSSFYGRCRNCLYLETDHSKSMDNDKK